MKENGGEKPIELIRPLGMKKRDHAAYVVQTLDLGAQRRLLVEVTVHEVAVLLRGDPAHAVYTDATWMPDHLADHVLRHFVLVLAHREVNVAPLAAVSTVEQRNEIFLDINHPPEICLLHVSSFQRNIGEPADTRQWNYNQPYSPEILEGWNVGIDRGIEGQRVYCQQRARLSWHD